MNRPHLFLGLLSMFGLIGNSALGAWSETISAAGGTALDLGASWAFGTQNNGNAGTVVAGANSGVLQISDTNAAAINGTFGGTGLVVSQTFQNVTVTATINPNEASDMNNSVGLAARSDLVGNGYGLIYDFANSEFHLLRFAAALPTYIASSDLSLPANEDYYLKLQITGTNLSGELYDSVGGSLLSSIGTTDVTYAGILTVRWQGVHATSPCGVAASNVRRGLPGRFATSLS
jgi:hypothetical protein